MGTEMELEAYDNDEKVWLSKSTCFKAYNTKNGKLYLINLYRKKEIKLQILNSWATNTCFISYFSDK